MGSVEDDVAGQRDVGGGPSQRVPFAEVEDQPLQRHAGHGSICGIADRSRWQVADLCRTVLALRSAHHRRGQDGKVEGLDDAHAERGLPRPLPGDPGLRVGGLREVDEFRQGVDVTRVRERLRRGE